MRPVILIFLKAPRPGQVKTRLAASVGAEKACAIYRTLAEGQLRRLPADCRVSVVFTPADAEPEMRSWLGDAYAFEPQAEGDLGRRLRLAFARAFDADAGPVIAIGGDCPGLGAGPIDRARGLLEEGGNEVVLGPTEDGGYYLIGLRAPRPGLFEDIPWSTPETRAATRARAESMGLALAQLETLYDIDEPADWQRARREGLLPEDAAT